MDPPIRRRPQPHRARGWMPRVCPFTPGASGARSASGSARHRRGSDAAGRRARRRSLGRRAASADVRWRCGGPRTRLRGGQGRLGARARRHSSGSGEAGRPARGVAPLPSAPRPRGHPSRPSSHRATGFPHLFGVIRRNSAARASGYAVPRAPMSAPCGYPGSAPWSAPASAPPLAQPLASPPRRAVRPLTR